MRSNYKKLGPFIRVVDIRNKENRKDNLLGVSTQKIFIDSVANTVGTDFKKYKVVKKHQFTYVPDTSRRGDKMGIAMLESLDQALVSQAYTVFEVKDSNQLDPEYLMMWFRRPEFDRYARFKSHGSVREIFDWQEMCDVELPVPSIEKQLEIVREYNVVNDRIVLNEQITQKLEDTAQALYKQWFVDFEFPISKEYAESIGKPELEGKPYKSSGGEMAIDTNDSHYPVIWENVTLGELVEIKRGASPRPIQDFLKDSGVPWVKISDASESPTKYIMSTKQFVSLDGAKKSRPVSKGDLIVSNSATPGVPMFMDIEACVHDGWLIFDDYQGISKEFLYYLILNRRQELLTSANGSIFKNLKTDILKSLSVLKVDNDFMEEITGLFVVINNSIYRNAKEHDLLIGLKEVVLARMTKG